MVSNESLTKLVNQVIGGKHELITRYEVKEYLPYLDSMSTNKFNVHMYFDFDSLQSKHGPTLNLDDKFDYDLIHKQVTDLFKYVNVSLFMLVPEFENYGSK